MHRKHKHRVQGLTSHETLLRSRMHRKQAQGQGFHESQEPGVSRVMRPYISGLAWTECKHKVEGLPSRESHEILSGSRMQRKQAQGQGSHESREPGVSRVMRPYRDSRVIRPCGSHESGDPGVSRVRRPRGRMDRMQSQGQGSHES